MVTLTDLLQRGKENAISSRVLVPVLGLRDTRALTQLIEKERRAGVPICASVTEPTGYYLASDADELRRYLHSLRRRENEVGRTREALAAILNTWEDGA